MARRTGQPRQGSPRSRRVDHRTQRLQTRARSLLPYPAHILVVEDETVLMHMLKRRIESMGLGVTVHGSSVEALEDFRSHPDDFDLLVTDNSMPTMTGLQLAQAALALRPGLKVMLVSGGDPDELAAVPGIRKVLSKPYSGPQLMAAIREVLED